MAFRSLLDNVLSSPGAQGALGGAASGAVVSLLLNPKARKGLGKTALTLGGAAALAGVGYYAYQKWQQGRPPTAPATPAGPAPRAVAATEPPQTVATLASLPPPEVEERLAMKLLYGMIAAASADGHLDERQMGQVLHTLETADLTAAEKQVVTRALSRPPTVEDLALLVSGPEEASEVYAACLLVIDPEAPAEHLFLRRLARAFALDPSLVTRLHAEARAQVA